MDITKLEGLGLTKQQSEVYFKLLEIGSSGVGTLTNRLDIARISCYDTLNRLVNKGLVSFINSRGKRVYHATNPEKILQIAKEREQEATRQRINIENILPELNKLNVNRGGDKEASIYKTKQGIKSLFELMLKIKETIYVLSATGKALQELKHDFHQWHKRREKNKIKTYVIFNEELRKKEVTEMPLSEIKFLAKGYSSPSTLFIFGDYVVTLIWSDLPFAFLIKSKDISKTYHNYFKLIWKKASR